MNGRGEAIPLSHFFISSSRVAKEFAFIYNTVMEYKVVELSTVTDEEIEKTLNHWVGHGYSFESIHFVTTESSKRPKMAFVFFTKKQ
jgi:hypothetical protein